MDLKTKILSVFFVIHTPVSGDIFVSIDSEVTRYHNGWSGGSRRYRASEMERMIERRGPTPVVPSALSELYSIIASFAPKAVSGEKEGF